MKRSAGLNEPHLYIPRPEDILEGEDKQIKRYIFGRKTTKFTDYEIQKLIKFKSQVIKHIQEFDYPSLLQSFQK